MTQTNRRPGASTAFTLIELLVSLFIIALLLTLLLGGINHVRNAAKRTACASNVRQIGLCLRLYADDNRGEIPAMYANLNSDQPTRPIAGIGVAVDTRPGGIKLLVAPPIGTAKQSYVKDARIFLCPGDGEIAPRQVTPDDFGRMDIGRSMSYAYMYVPASGDSYWHSKKTWFYGKNIAYARHNVTQSNAGSLAVLTDSGPEPAMEGYSGRTIPSFHGPGWNVLYLDGHVAYVPIKNTQRHLAALPKESLSVAIALDREAGAAY